MGPTKERSSGGSCSSQGSVRHPDIVAVDKEKEGIKEQDFATPHQDPTSKSDTLAQWWDDYKAKPLPRCRKLTISPLCSRQLMTMTAISDTIQVIGGHSGIPFGSPPIDHSVRGGNTGYRSHASAFHRPRPASSHLATLVLHGLHEIAGSRQELARNPVLLSDIIDTRLYCLGPELLAKAFAYSITRPGHTGMKI